MKNYTFRLSSPEEAEELIRTCESDFRARLDAAVDTILAIRDVRILALSGPTCSGKTTTAGRLIEKINDSGRHAVVISIDDFFHDRSDRNRVDLKAPDYDSAEAIDLAYLSVFLTRLREGKSVLIPRYDFTLTRRVGYDEYLPTASDIYVVEGIQAVYPEITAWFGDYRSVFISVTDDVSVNGVPFDRHEIRLLRRIVRDFKFRGATPEFSLHLWQGVRENEEKNIFPNAGACDVYLDSFLPYELFVIRSYALPLLAGVPVTSEYRAEADRLAKKLSDVQTGADDALFDDRMIPNNSVFREFIG
ncbi:MAG: uridine kinase [Eubacteriales bacterium]